MAVPRSLWSCALAALIVPAVVSLGSSGNAEGARPFATLFAQSPQPSPSLAVREAAYRANNRGVALLEQFQPAEAAEALREALKLDPSLALARINLAIALFNVPELAAAEQEARAAA